MRASVGRLSRHAFCSNSVGLSILRSRITHGHKHFSISSYQLRESDPRIKELDLGREIADEYAHIRDHYDAPKNPIVLAHGLLGFSELRLAGRLLPPIHYWHGIKESLEAQGSTVYATEVPPSDTIARRAAELGRSIAELSKGRPVNVVAHSMGGLDARHLIAALSRGNKAALAPAPGQASRHGHGQGQDHHRGAEDEPGFEDLNLQIASLVTIATPHRGSAYADAVLSALGPNALPAVQRATGLSTGAFAQLTTRYMAESFNPATPDSPEVRYFSYGAAMDMQPGLFSPFRRSWAVLQRSEGPNDGLVSVESSKWGSYKGTIKNVSHLDLINWSNRLRWAVKSWTGEERTFNAIAFYLDIADMLAKEGL